MNFLIIYLHFQVLLCIVIISLYLHVLKYVENNMFQPQIANHDLLFELFITFSLKTFLDSLNILHLKSLRT